MQVCLTANEAIGIGIWDRLCDLRGWSVWCVNEGLMDSEERIILTEEEATLFGLLGDQ